MSAAKRRSTAPLPAGRPSARSTCAVSRTSPAEGSARKRRRHTSGTTYTGRASPRSRSARAASHAMSTMPGSSGPTRSPCQVAVPSGCSSTPCPASAQRTE